MWFSRVTFVDDSPCHTMTKAWTYLQGLGQQATASRTPEGLHKATLNVPLISTETLRKTNTEFLFV